MRLMLAIIACSLAETVASAAGNDLPPRPVAKKRPVTHTYFGISVVDDYQYLENMADPEVRDWATGQNRVTRAWLDGRPEREAIAKRVVALTHSDSPEWWDLRWRRGTLFAMKDQPPKEQPFLIALGSMTDLGTERVVVDPNVIDGSGGTSIDFYVPSLDGKLVAVSLSQGGSEDGTLHVYEAATGKPLPDVLPRVNGGTAGGSVAWNADGSGFYYTRYPKKGERPDADLPFYQQIYFHKLGAPASADVHVLGRDFPKIAEIELSTSEDGKTVLVDVSNGDGGEHAYQLIGADGKAVQVTRFEDKAVEAHLGLDGALYLLSRKDAPMGKIVRVAIEKPDLARATVVVPEGSNAIEYFVPTKGRLYIVEIAGGPSRLAMYDLSGKPVGTLYEKDLESVGSIVRTENDAILVRTESYITTPSYFRYDPKGGLSATALQHKSPADYSDCEVRREMAAAEDGTDIPVNIIMKKGTKLDGKNPALLYAYGSYGINQAPHFSDHRRLFIEQGGVYAVASIRGGGEFGDAWHKAAYLEKKKRSIDDFAAVARYLVAKGYTSRERLAIEGGSAGGLLMYGVLVHYPDLMRAVLAHVGYGDVLRTELSPNGEFNVTEFGTVKDETQFRGMYAYSPYHHVKDGTPYPSVLATTGLNDPRVEPWQSFKMVARLQAVGAKNPILLRTSGKAGHGIGTALSERDQELADAYTFLFAQLGVPYKPVSQ